MTGLLAIACVLLDLSGRFDSEACESDQFRVRDKNPPTDPHYLKLFFFDDVIELAQRDRQQSRCCAT